jgi:hypothetical protein
MEAIMQVKRKLTVRQSHFVAELAKGSSQKRAAEAAGYTRTSARRGGILERTHVREALEDQLEGQGVTPEYLVARIKDLCEASEEREDGRTAPSWCARIKGAELLMRILRADKLAEAIQPEFEEMVSRMLEEAREFDPGFSVVELENSEEGIRTEVVVFKEQT